MPFFLISYIGTFYFWDKIKINFYLDIAFILSKKIMPFWFPVLLGSVFDNIYCVPYKMTSITFFITQIIFYKISKIWNYQYLYKIFSLICIIALQKTIATYHAKESFFSDWHCIINGLILSVLFIILMRSISKKNKV